MGRKKDSPVAEGTIGGTEAARVLEDMMNGGVVSVKEKHKALSLIATATYCFKCLLDITDPAVRTHCFQMMRNHYIQQIEENRFPKSFTSHLKNVMMHHCRRIEKKGLK